MGKKKVKIFFRSRKGAWKIAAIAFSALLGVLCAISIGYLCAALPKLAGSARGYAVSAVVALFCALSLLIASAALAVVKVNCPFGASVADFYYILSAGALVCEAGGMLLLWQVFVEIDGVIDKTIFAADYRPLAVAMRVFYCASVVHMNGLVLLYGVTRWFKGRKNMMKEAE